MQNMMIFGELTILNPPSDYTPIDILHRLRELADGVELVRRCHRITPEVISAEGIRVTCNSEFSYEKLLREEIYLGTQVLNIQEIEGRSAYDNPYLVGADKRIYLKRVPARVKESDLVKYFSKYGEVELALILKYRVEPNKKNSGDIVGHVVFEDSESQ